MLDTGEVKVSDYIWIDNEIGSFPAVITKVEEKAFTAISFMDFYTKWIIPRNVQRIDIRPSSISEVRSFFMNHAASIEDEEKRETYMHQSDVYLMGEVQ